MLGIGFAFTGRSKVNDVIQQAWGPNTTLGQPLLASLFRQNASLPASFDIELGRVRDQQTFADGSFLIGAHAPGRAAVEHAPQVQVKVQGQWSVLLDGLSANGRNYTFRPAQNSRTPHGSLIAVLDTGSTAASLPADAVDFIFSGIQGAVQLSNGSWYAPCYSAANVTLYFGLV